MGLRNLLGRAAAGSPVPVFPLAGAGAHLAELRLSPAVDIVGTPRHATVLLVTGAFPPGEVAGAAGIHDLLPSPRATVRWNGDPLPGLIPSVVGAGEVAGLVAVLVATHRRLLTGELPSEAPLLPDVDPVPWRGVGPYGQGGKGMTGGTPYGRPMAERAPDRDGLELDRIPVDAGPWLSAFPPGLHIRVGLQGDVIQEAEVRGSPTGTLAGSPFLTALDRAVPIVELETARARHHLERLAEGLRLHGLGALGIRALRLSRTLDRPGIDRLFRAVRRSGLLSLALRGVGPIGPDRAEGWGPAARAAGLPDDARADEAAYGALGFEPITGHGGDVADRWRQRMAEIGQSLDLAARAGESTAFGAGIVESPGGRLTATGPHPGDRMLAALPDLLVGLEWGDAVAVVASLDLETRNPTPS